MAQLTITSLVNFEVESAIHHLWLAGHRMDYPSQHYQLWLIEEGEVAVCSGERSWQLGSGEAFLAPVHFPRHISSATGVTLFSVGYRTPSFNQRNIFDDLPLPVQWRPSKTDYKSIKSWMAQVTRLHLKREFGQQLVEQGLGLAILGVCWPYLSKASTEQIAREMLPHWLSTTLRRMKESPDITINQLARQAGFSPAQFRKNFHQWMGSPPQQYLNAQRLETARFLLGTSDLSVDAIAGHVGLKSGNYLSEIFKRHFGYTPSFYRSLRRSPGG